jgi:Type II secretion system (T2SS), protein E, N-terminal domain
VSASVKPPKGITPPSAPGGRSGFLSDVIVELGFADSETVEQAVERARRLGTTDARVLLEMEALSEEQLARATAERHGIAFIDLDEYEIDPAAANLIKPTVARRYSSVPVGLVGGALLVAMADPADALGVNDIAVMTKLEVVPAVAPRPAIEALLERLPLTEPGAGAADGQARSAPSEGASQRMQASSAVFWQAPDGVGSGVGDELPIEDASDASEAAAEQPGGGGEVAELRRERDALRKRLALAESELERLRERLAAADAELEAEPAGARGRDR